LTILPDVTIISPVKGGYEPDEQSFMNPSLALKIDFHTMIALVSVLTKESAGVIQAIGGRTMTSPGVTGRL